MFLQKKKFVITSFCIKTVNEGLTAEVGPEYIKRQIVEVERDLAKNAHWTLLHSALKLNGPFLANKSLFKIIIITQV